MYASRSVSPCLTSTSLEAPSQAGNPSAFRSLRLQCSQGLHTLLLQADKLQAPSRHVGRPEPYASGVKLESPLLTSPA